MISIVHTEQSVLTYLPIALNNLAIYDAHFS